jgi:cell division protein FtsQ
LVAVRGKRISPRLLAVLYVIAVLVALGLASYGLATFALDSPCFVLASPEDVVVEGGQHVSREEVLGALGLRLTANPRRGRNVFRLSLDDLRREVETLRWVRSASVVRVLPHGLRVRVTERIPVAYANVNGRVSLVDEDGVVLDKPDNGVFDFPVLYGLDNLAGFDERRARVVLYLEFNRQLGEETRRAGWLISEVNLADAEDLKALLISGHETVQVHFGEKDFLARFRTFLDLLPEIQKSNDKIDSVDLRYHNQVVVDPQPPAPVAERAAGSERKD